MLLVSYRLDDSSRLGRFVPLKMIEEAISRRQQLSFSYGGLARIVVPTAVGQDRKGQLILAAYQVGGASSTGGVGDGTPKIFKVAKMSDVTVLGVPFQIPSQYEPGDKRMTSIIAEL